MKRLNVILLGSLFLLFAACDRNNIGSEPVIEAPLQVLNYDSPVQTAPLLPGGEYEVAARFNATETAELRGGNLVQLYFYLFSRPASCTVKIYKGSNSDGPVELVYSAGISSSVEAGSWNRHVLTNPVAIENDDYWLAVKFSHTNQAQVFGCDPGPAHPDGDWMLSNADNSWQSFRQRTNQEASINWNIRGVVEP